TLGPAIRLRIQDDTARATGRPSATILEELLPGGVRGTPTQRFVSETYRDLLHRPVDQSGLDTWSPQIDALVAQGMPADQAQKTVVFRIETDSGHEYFHDLVHSFYVQYLHRSEGPSDQAAFDGEVNFLAATVPTW